MTFAPFFSPTHISNHGRAASLLALALGLIVLAFGRTTILAQGSKQDYQRAAELSRNTENAVFRGRVQPVWLAAGTSFWYRVQTGSNTHEFVAVDASTGRKFPAFDHPALASSLGMLANTNLNHRALPLESIEFTEGFAEVRFRSLSKSWAWNNGSRSLTTIDRPEPSLRPSNSRTTRSRSNRTGEETEIVFVNRTSSDADLFWLDSEGRRRGYGRIRPGQERRQHTFEGHVWLLTDPQGSTLAVFEATAGSARAVVEEGTGAGKNTNTAAPTADPEPRKAPEGETSPDGKWTVLVRDHNLQLRENSNGSITALTSDATKEAFFRGNVKWSPDSSHLVAMQINPAQEHKIHFVESSPSDQLQPRLHSHDYLKPGDRVSRATPRLFEAATKRSVPVDTSLFPQPYATGDIRWFPDSSEFVFTYNQRGHQVLRIIAVRASDGRARTVVENTSTTFVDYAHKSLTHWLDQTGEVIWMSERDGWNHLWLHDAKTGSIKNQITRGEWAVRSVEKVDDSTRQIWFFAGGVRPGEDPYHLHLCRVNFDGSGFRVLTEGDGTHSIVFSPDRRWFVDTWSRVDLPPVTELRNSTDGSLVLELERADWRPLLAAGWTIPERFKTIGRDGKSEIWGILIKPSGFNPSKKYPVVEEIYAGPHGAHVPKSFGRMVRQHSIAELGFIVVQIDGMGTSHRSKAFQEVSWKNLADAGFPDRRLWIRAAASTRRWMDLNRIGIYGGSAGGQNAMRALLDHGDFYKVAVADCGCHDNRMDKIWWNELWMGWPVDESYLRSSNVADAHKLQGRLMLIVGEMDTNVDPASTFQVVHALEKADKDFELLVMTGTGHGAAETPYASRRRMDFLVRHLHGREPRWE